MKVKEVPAQETKAQPEEIRVPKTRRQLGDELLMPFIEQETKLVKGRFRNYETPGGGVRVQVRKYPERLGVKPFDKYLMDEGIYEIPLYVARYLNGTDATATHESVQGKIHTCSYGIHGFKTDRNATNLPRGIETVSPDGQMTVIPETTIAKRVRRYGFESLEFAE